MLMKSFFAALATTICFSVAAQTPQAPEVAARAYLLMDVSANQILASKDLDMPVEPASLTKLMSAYLVFHALPPQVAPSQLPKESFRS